MKKLLQQALDALNDLTDDIDGTDYALNNSFGNALDLMREIRSEIIKHENSPPLNNVTATAPKEIYLCISDDPDDAETEFNYFDVDWCEDEPLDVCVKYIRADLK